MTPTIFRTRLINTAFFLLVFAGLILLWHGVARSEEISVERLADAIYHAEGGAKTRHPYGILAKYKHTTPRQACINTINSNYKRWVKAGKPGKFISWLGNTYCPVGAANDPTGLNKNWKRNVSYYYTRLAGRRK
jgi:hypothetical protein